jgi:hypothetical protein
MGKGTNVSYTLIWTVGGKRLQQKIRASDGVGVISKPVNLLIYP